MEILRITTIVYLSLFSFYHVITGIISVFFPNFSLKFYKKIYGLQPPETKQLLMTFKPWGGLSITAGIVGFIVLTDIDRNYLFLFSFFVLLAIRFWARILYRKELGEDFKVTPFQNLRMITLQGIGAVLFLLFPLFRLLNY